MVRVKVPATCANMGPGFDTFGIAFNIYNTVEVCEIPTGLIIEGCDEKYINEENLVYTTLNTVFKLADFKPSGIKISIKSDIKESSGLGSSSACIIAGLFAANEMVGRKFSKEELIDLAVKIEGHPDNVVPAICGGFVMAVIDDDRVYYKKIEVSKKLHFYILTSNIEKISTNELRKRLPKSISLKDGIFNLSHGLMLVEGLREGNFDFIQAGAKDRFHQPYRKTYIEGYDEIHKKAMECGAKALVISGAGPTLLSIFPDKKIDKFKNYLKSLDNSWEIIPCEVDDFGVVVENNI